jgi:hypothetical protein
MSAAKLSAAELSRLPLRSVYVYVTTDPGGHLPVRVEADRDDAWYPSRNRAGRVALVERVEAARSNRSTRYDVHTDQGVIAGLVPTRAFVVAQPPAPLAVAGRGGEHERITRPAGTTGAPYVSDWSVMGATRRR